MKWTILLITLIELHLVRSQISLTLNQLLKDVFTNYDKRTRPFENEQPLIFSARLTEAMLVKLDTESQTVSFNLAQYLKWQDPRLVWDPAKYDNISQFYIPTSLLWMPKIYFYNSIQTSSSLSDPDALILSNGNITVYLATFVTCASDVYMDRDSEAQTASFNIAQYLKWQDPRLVWDPAKYNNISQFYIPTSSIWTPNIFFYNR
uniref:Neurotransmitter-gated ion-channel ligand-binding domain-containing protein n=1 Tax=Acrobeloides nanus TaxID=290746 RepID=A0A914EAE7_9BILA